MNTDKYRLWGRGRLIERVIGPMNSRIYPRYRNSTNVIDEDWDNLVILDACRADLFEDVFNLDQFGFYSEKISVGGTTTEWIRNTFGEENFGDVVYISGNPFVTKLSGGSFHKLINVWKTDFDEDEKTVLPGDVAKMALNAHEKHPNKRLIVHFMQPHIPFIGYDELRFGGYHPDHETPEIIQSVWDALALGDVKKQDVWNAYKQNLEIAEDDIFKLLNRLDGKSVITSDHGNLFGERGFPIPIQLYGHWAKVRHPALVTVPWAVINGERRSVHDGKTTGVKYDENMMHERLQHLGYKQ